ncbi:MAG: signal peptide peptidase SppA [Alphaproteobacteria bacterium]|nr:signal peptide peptidase SppA [Alphaproteobacteria bacterium]MCB9931588.1 signal peptide peptidase SppA [Alphaproteobacteria bacterium]
MGWTPDPNGTADRMVDRRRLKRQVVLWRSLALVVVTVLATLLAMRLAGDDSSGAFAKGPHIARLSIAGVIQTDQSLLDRIDRLTRDGTVRAVLLHIDSPGGTYAGAEALYGALRQLAAAKPVVAVMDGVAASGGYMAAVATDHIVARAGTITGSVGVIMQMPRLKGLLDSLGIQVEEVRSGPLKATPSPFETPDEPARAATRALIDDLFRQFLTIVTSRRPLAEPTLEQVRTGRVFTGRQALPLGLIDAIGGEAEARHWLASEHGIAADLPVRNVDSDGTDDWVREALKRLGAGSLLRIQGSVDGPWVIWHPSL